MTQGFLRMAWPFSSKEGQGLWGPLESMIVMWEEVGREWSFGRLSHGLPLSKIRELSDHQKYKLC